MADNIVSEGGTGAPTEGVGGLNVPLGVHFDALMQWMKEFQHERDRRYADLRIDDQKALDRALSATQLAIDKAETRLTEQLAGFPQEYATQDEVERMREDLVKLTREAVPQELYAERHRILEEKIVDIQRILSGTVGEKSQAERDTTRQQWVVGVGITIVVVVINLVFYLATTH